MNNGLEEILDKCCCLMSREGFHGASMRDLARETGRSLAGLYYYFDTKEELLRLIYLNGYSRLINQAQRLLRNESLPGRRLLIFINNHLTYSRTHPDEMRVLMTDLTPGTVDHDGIVSERRKAYFCLATELVRAVVALGSSERLSKKAIARSTALLFGMMNSHIGCCGGEEMGSKDTLVKEIYGMFTSGICGRV